MRDQNLPINRPGATRQGSQSSLANFRTLCIFFMARWNCISSSPCTVVITLSKALASQLRSAEPPARADIISSAVPKSEPKPYPGAHRAILLLHITGVKRVSRHFSPKLSIKFEEARVRPSNSLVALSLQQHSWHQYVITINPAVPCRAWSYTLS